MSLDGGQLGLAVYCARCDLLVGLPGFHVLAVGEHVGGLHVVVESAAVPAGCPVCGVVAVATAAATCS